MYIQSKNIVNELLSMKGKMTEEFHGSNFAIYKVRNVLKSLEEEKKGWYNEERTLYSIYCTYKHINMWIMYIHTSKPRMHVAAFNQGRPYILRSTVRDEIPLNNYLWWTRMRYHGYLWTENNISEPAALPGSCFYIKQAPWPFTGYRFNRRALCC